MATRKSAPINVGTSSIMMLFAVLCLTVFSVLSLVSARSQASLARKSADAVSAYYAADTRAAGIYEELRAGGLPETVTVSEYPDGTYYAYEVPVDENQVLSVLVCQAGEEFEILSWKVTSTADWSADGQINVWGGN